MFTITYNKENMHKYSTIIIEKLWQTYRMKNYVPIKSYYEKTNGMRKMLTYNIA